MIRLLRKIINFLLLIIVVILTIVFVVYNVLYPMQYKEEILKYSKEYEIDPYMVYAVINVESNFNKFAKSNAEARGLMQIREITADWAKEHITLKELEEDDYFNPDINLNIGCWYLKKLSNIYDNDIVFISAAYNAGIGNVDKWIEEGRDLKNGDIPFEETKKYVKKVQSNIEVYKVLYGDDYTNKDLFHAIINIIDVIFEKGGKQIDKVLKLKN